MRSVDATVLVGSLAGHGEAEAFIRNEGPVWVSHLVLTEAVKVLEGVYGRTRAQLAEALEMVLDNKDVVLEDPSVPRAALKNYRNGVDFEDAMALEVAGRAGHLPLATLRDGLRGIPGTVVPGA